MSVHYSTNNKRYGYDFITKEYIPIGKDEYYLRNIQAAAMYAIKSPIENNFPWRQLTLTEIKKLEANGNFSSDWSKVLVSDEFDTDSIRRSSFYGLVRLGKIGSGILQFHDYAVQEGIRNSTIISCDIGSHCAIDNCAYISHYVVGNNVILSKIDEMDTTNHCKAGNGIVKQGEDESVRIWIEPLNEAGGRDVLPFYDMICADAYMWTIFRDDEQLMQSLFDITNASYDNRRGFYGLVCSNAVIKSCHTIKDVNVGESAYIKGANKLKNLTIKSDEDSPAQIGEGVELVNGIIGYGCHVFYGCKAVRFVMGNNSNLKYGARLIHSILGDNSTISCCEVLNNLVFPGHEQHHNNSFLIASMIMGQSNMAAGATVGSNHNSRGNDGEIIAGRGFWPGLSSTLKHNSRFASFTLITKGNYPNELNIPLPFSMLVENSQHNRLEVMPAYYWMYNMYALERNSWKYKNRDKRVHVDQHIISDYLAPDTAKEIITAIRLLEEWTGKAIYKNLGDEIPENVDKISARGRKYLLLKKDVVRNLSVIGENLERSKRPVQIIKVAESYNAYRQMLIMYAVKAIIDYLEITNQNFSAIQELKTTQENLLWQNMGGQLVPENSFKELRNKIVGGVLKTWIDIHSEYEKFWNRYVYDNMLTALEVLKFVYNSSDSASNWKNALKDAENIRLFMDEQIYKTKLKDYTNAFRGCTYRNQKERFAVLGKVEDNSFIKSSKIDSAKFCQLLEKYSFD